MAVEKNLKPAAAERTSVPDGTGLIAGDPWLEPFAPQLRQRWEHYITMRFQALKSPIRCNCAAAGAHSLYHIPAWPSC